jgi:putative tryptophan/tyrosine transport system substrate-binding protein
MRRREFIAGLGNVIVWPVGVCAQQPALPTIGVLDERPLGPGTKDFADPFRQGLAESGFVEGRNVAIEYRSAEGHPQRLPALAADLVLRKHALIATVGTNSALAAKAATRSVPIVFELGSDPVELGLVASLNRPGGNLTGVAELGSATTSKRLDLLHKLVPTADLIAVFASSADTPYDQAETRDLQSIGRSLGVRLLLLHASADHDIVAAFATLVEQKAGALLVGGALPLNAAREQIISLAARHSIPTMFFYTPIVGAGGLLSYGPDFVYSYRQLGIYAGRILKGEKPGDLPVFQPGKFILAINLKTAKTLGLEIPPGVLAIADEVIE